MAAVAWSEHDGSERIAAYWPLFERCARRFVGMQGAEFDDLVQEGAIAGWLAFEAGWYPTELVIERALIRYCRSLNTGGWRLVAES
jgi:DNA-directed RNA polymerase specialized sigma24 family protein